ncbi:E3 ubiquitin-protein ligase sina-like [Euwallacea fornicatus]|uniref:E3 ubiquitin-protein ligase sina-like n=1 Tax=Euwallacea fornicatus TaxID=995702 RepID=UPI00338D7FF3
MSRKVISNPSTVTDPNKLVECPICLEIISPPIVHCQNAGHVMCKTCFNASKLNRCPLCTSPMSDKRHITFEQLLENFRATLLTSCRYTYKGCKYNISSGNKDSHELECKFRTFKCEGKIFAGWNCDWIGSYDQIEDHFKKAHLENTMLQYRGEASTKHNFHADFKDVHLISFFNGQSYFYYKHFVDCTKEKVYWTFQYIGLKSTAQHFFYEFEVHNGPIRKFKVSEVCHADSDKSDDIFKNEKCVVMSFASVRNFLDSEGELSFRFRIRKIKA